MSDPGPGRARAPGTPGIAKVQNTLSRIETLPMFKFRNTAGKEMPIRDMAGLARRGGLPDPGMKASHRLCAALTFASIIVLILEKCFWF
jgi:hypothetical protein